MSEGTTSVVVVVRVRPMNGTERAERAQRCIQPGTNNQIVIGKDKAFTFDNIYWEDCAQNDIYDTSVKPLVKNFFEGYNATILAYGQTGSGKTFTMGTAASSTHVREADMGILPRVIKDIFSFIEANSETSEFSIRCSFLEIHNEDIVDLLDPSPHEKPISIRETTQGGISVIGVEEQIVQTYTELIGCLEDGSLRRATGSTNMNAVSSRSHAIFSIFLTQRKINTNNQDIASDLVSKFNFVDLAGSERLKKTGASGDRMKEGININCGLLALGNVISALGDPKKRGQHVPFRDSKITRLLQDSLGGNSRTIMMACISPADMNFEESASTLAYANRARNIQNKPVVNRDPVAARMEALVARIHQLESLMTTNGINVPDSVEQTPLKNNQTASMLRRLSNSFLDSNTTFAPTALLDTNELENEILRLECSNSELQHNLGQLQSALLKSKDLKDSYKSKFEKSLELLKSNNIPFDGVDFNADTKTVTTLNAKVFELESALRQLQLVKKSNLLSVDLNDAQNYSKTQESGNDNSELENPSNYPPLEDEPAIETSELDVIKEAYGIRKSYGVTKLVDEAKDNDDFENSSVDDAELDKVLVRSESETLTIVQDIQNRSMSMEVDDIDSNKNDVNSLMPIETIAEEKVEKVEDEDAIYEIAALNIIQDKRDVEFQNDQINLSRTLQKLDIHVNNKESLVAELIKNRETIQQLKRSYEQKITELEIEVQQVQIEKNRVLAEAERSSGSQSTGIVSAKYDKKLKDLELALSTAREKLKENQRLAKARTVDDSRIRQLQQEIDQMKKQRVSVARQMKDQTDKHRLWVLDTDGQLKALRKSVLQKDKLVRDLKLQYDQQQNVIRRRMEENSSLQNRLKLLEGKQAHVLSTRSLGSRFGKSARGKTYNVGGSDENNSSSPNRVLRLRTHTLNNYSPAKKNPMPFSSPFSVISRWNSSSDNQTESIKNSLNNEVKSALKKYDMSLNVSRLSIQRQELVAQLNRYQQSILDSKNEMKEKRMLFDSQEEQRILDLLPTTNDNILSSESENKKGDINLMNLSGIITTRELERDQMEIDRLVESADLCQEQIKFVDKQISDVQSEIANFVPNEIESEIKSSGVISTEGELNVMPALAMLADVDQAKWLINHLTAELFAIKKRKICTSRQMLNKITFDSIPENKEVVDIESNDGPEYKKAKKAAFYESAEYNQMASHRVNVFDRLVSESGLVGIHKHKTDDRDSKIPKANNTAKSLLVNKRVTDDLQNENSASGQYHSLPKNLKFKINPVSVSDGLDFGSSLIKADSLPNSKTNSPLSSPAVSDFHSMDHLDISENGTRANRTYSENVAAGNVFSRLTEKTGYTGISKYAQPINPDSKSIRPKTARVDAQHNSHIAVNPNHQLSLDDSVINSINTSNSSIPIYERLFKTTLESKRLGDEIVAVKQVVALVSNSVRNKKRPSIIVNETVKHNSNNFKKDGNKLNSLSSPNIYGDQDCGSSTSSTRNSNNFTTNVDSESTVETNRSTKNSALAETPLSDLFAKLQEKRLSSDDMQIVEVDAESNFTQSSVKDVSVTEEKLEDNFENLSKELNSYWTTRNH